jgi:hypothetical protein
MSYIAIPQISGPSLIFRSSICFLATESGDLFLLEDGSGFIQLQMCNQPSNSYLFALENNSGTILLEDGVDSLELEDGP